MAKRTVKPSSKRKLNARQIAAKAREKIDRKTVVALKRKGIAFEGHSIKGRPLTSYEKRRARQLAPILSGEYEAIKVTPTQRRRFGKDEDVKARTKGFLIVENKPDIVQTIRKGLRSFARPMADGMTIERLQVPGGPKFRNVMKFLRSGQAREYKLEDEAFSFIFEEGRHARIYWEASDLIEVLNRYVDEDDLDEDDEPRVYLYRVHPPDDWYRLVQEEARERIATLREEARGLRGSEARRLRFAIQRQEYKIKSTPERIYKTKDERRLAFLEKERARYQKNIKNDAYRREKQRKDRERIAAKRKAKKSGK